jgi:hypothetical protein
MDVKHAKPTKPTKHAKPTKPTKHAKPTKPTKPTKVGKATKPAEPASSAQPAKPGTERARDESRHGGGPRYGGGPWRSADERGDRRFGHARVDDADPSELAPGEAGNDDSSPSAADPELAAAAGEIESSGQRAGMRRGEKPRKVKARER